MTFYNTVNMHCPAMLQVTMMGENSTNHMAKITQWRIPCKPV